MREIDFIAMCALLGFAALVAVYILSYKVRMAFRLLSKEAQFFVSILARFMAEAVVVCAIFGGFVYFLS